MMDTGDTVKTNGCDTENSLSAEGSPFGIVISFINKVPSYQ